MTSEFDSAIPAFRLVNTSRGDTLAQVAARELGDPNRWVELVWLNNLAHPFITDDPERVAPGVLLSGAQIRVPAPGGFSDATVDSNARVYEADCKIERRRLVAENGDFAAVAGVPNLSQQLGHRVATPMGQLFRHPDYGCRVYQLIGTVNGRTAEKLGAEFVRAALLADYRVRAVPASGATILGDVVNIKATAQAVTGDTLKVGT